MTETIKKTIDFNCDCGELTDGGASDSLIIPVVTSVNIACGYHAGSPEDMRRTVRLAKASGCSIGAHPGFPDRENFGRTRMELPPAEVERIVCDQVALLMEICEEEGAHVAHVKPHGALYNMAAKDPVLAGAICRGVLRASEAQGYGCVECEGAKGATENAIPLPIVVGLAGSCVREAAQESGLRFASEAFADRAYMDDGTLMPRTMPGSVITDESLIIKRVARLVTEGVVESASGRLIGLEADTLCLHGDTPGAAEFALKIKAALEAAGSGVAPLV